MEKMKKNWLFKMFADYADLTYVKIKLQIFYIPLFSSKSIKGMFEFNTIVNSLINYNFEYLRKRYKNLACSCASW